jgi:hypothetical protein
MRNWTAVCFFGALLLVGCASGAEDEQLDDRTTIESCALKSFRNDGWLLGMVPALPHDSIDRAVIQIPSFFQSITLHVDSLQTDCADILYTHLALEIYRNKLQRFSTVITCYDGEIYRKVPELLGEKMKTITGQRVEKSAYMVWTIFTDNSRWLIELRDMRSVLDTTAYEYVVRNAGSY